ncbi:MAG TPA: uL15 family ribosomal protein [Candidatus Paceibacterota bacterium]|jgi:large subunit ribosomal protein L15|nr:uL15 family ribosomal protein [Candidatus Paceibacterota bacterium]
MQINNQKLQSKRKRAKRVGRGGKRGTYSGRGQKGQKSRAGRKIHSELRVMFLRIPKRRGSGNKTIHKKTKDIGLDTIAKNFNDNTIISPKSLKEKGLIKSVKDNVKILGSKNVLSKKYTIIDINMSQGAKNQLEKAGGIIKSTKNNQQNK